MLCLRGCVQKQDIRANELLPQNSGKRCILIGCGLVGNWNGILGEPSLF